MKRFPVLTSLFFCCGVSTWDASRAVGAAAAESDVAPLTLATALQLAVDNNPSLAAQRYGERTAEALMEQAGVSPNPTLDVTVENFLGTGQSQGVRRLEATVQANQTLERGGKREKRMALAGRERETTAQEIAVQRAELLATTAVAFAETIAAQQRVALAEEPLQLARETLTAVEARVNAGEASPAESARARAAMAAAQAELSRARAQLAMARTTLAAAWGGESLESASLEGQLRVSDSLPDEKGLRAAMASHPRLEFQRSIIATRRAALELAQAQGVQDVTLGGGVRFLREGTDATFVVGVSLPIPVRHKNQGNIRAARETLAGAEQSMRAIENQLHIAFLTAWQELELAHRAAQELRREALPATEEAQAIVRRAYQEGQLPLIDVLEAQRALVVIRRELLEAEAAYAVALARVEGLAGSTFTLSTALLSSE